MAAESDLALTSDNDNSIVTQTAPESIGPGELGSNVIQKIIDSKWSRVNDLLTLPAKDVTKAELATAIGASSLNDRTNGFSVNQVLKITDRTDTFPMYVQITSANTISPFGVWVKNNTTPLAVIMDYVGGYQGETSPFIAIFDENRNLSVVTPLIIADGTEGDKKTLTSDADGKTSWGKELDSGTYVPTLFNTTNIDGSTPYQCQYMRVGNVVTVSGMFEINPTAGAPTSTIMGISLPIASDFALQQNCGGTAFASTPSQQGGAIEADATNDMAKLAFMATETNNIVMKFSFTYLII